MADEEPAPYELPDRQVADAWTRLLGDYLIVEPLEPSLAARLVALGTGRFAELGSAGGPISRLLAPQGVQCVALDRLPPDEHFRPMVRADLRALPFPADHFDAVSAVNCLYFLGQPETAVAEAQAVLRPGGTFLASAPSRYHDPELAAVVPGWGTPSPFDAEEAAEIVGSVFDEVEAEWWEVPAYVLPDRRAVVDYLVAFRHPDAERLADGVEPPLTITKSGCDVWATK